MTVPGRAFGPAPGLPNPGRRDRLPLRPRPEAGYVESIDGNGSACLNIEKKVGGSLLRAATHRGGSGVWRMLRFETAERVRLDPRDWRASLSAFRTRQDKNGGL